MAYRFVYYDTETTGLKPDKDKIIEIAFYDPTNQKQINHFVNPERPIPPESVAICNITDDMVQDAPTFKELAPKIIEFLDEDVALVAHNNISFDKRFIESEFQRAGVELPKYKYIDSLHWARKYRPDLPKHTLQYLREIYGIDANNAHRALDDVIILEKLFSLMIDDLSCNTVIQLLEKKDVTKMPFGKHQGKELIDVPRNYFQWLQKSGAFEREDNKDLHQELLKLNILQKN